MALLSCVASDTPISPYINTGSLFDLLTGCYRPSADGKWILDGGIPLCLGASGRPQTYKSGIVGGLLARGLINHPNAEAYVYETENTISGPERYDDFIPKISGVNNISDRIVFKNSTNCNLTEFYEDVTQIFNEKIKHKKDYIVDSPFLNHKTGKPYKIFIPTFIVVDSFSRARSGKGDEQFTANSVDDASMNTLWLLEGNVKSKIMSDLPSKAAKAGLYVMLTAHVGDKKDISNADRFSPKQLQYMRSTDRMKNVGSNFDFLVTTLLQTLKADVLMTDAKDCLYPAKFSTNVEVNEVTSMLVRCKNNASGIPFPFVISQYQGLLDHVTNFHFLKKNKNFGLIVSGKNNIYCTQLKPDRTFMRTTIREILDSDYATARALELIAQLCFIQKLWCTWKLPEYIETPPEKLAEMLSNSKKCSVERVLSSTGVWSTSKQSRERLTLLDILSFLHDEFKDSKIFDMGAK